MTVRTADADFPHPFWNTKLFTASRAFQDLMSLVLCSRICPIGIRRSPAKPGTYPGGKLQIPLILSGPCTNIPRKHPAVNVDQQNDCDPVDDPRMEKEIDHDENQGYDGQCPIELIHSIPSSHQIRKPHRESTH